VNEVVYAGGESSRREERKEALLDAAADYVVAHGLRDLSIRPLAAALGMSHRTLLYYFESKDKLVLAVLDVVRQRDREKIRAYLAAAQVGSPTGLFRAAWSYFTAAERVPYIRFIHEVFVLGLREPTYRAWVESTFESRTEMIAAALANMGVPQARTRPAATLITAAVRGLQLHLLTTDDRVTTDAAFEELLSGLAAQLPS
jgi:AcrR family transcriptional regulator